MQDYVNDRTISVSIKGGRISAEILKKALVKVVHMLEKEHAKSVAGKKEKIPQGKQTLKDLTKQRDKLANIQVTNKNIGSFDRVARKYDIDYALKKDRSVSPPVYYVFFKAKDKIGRHGKVLDNCRVLAIKYRKNAKKAYIFTPFSHRITRQELRQV